MVFYHGEINRQRRAYISCLKNFLATMPAEISRANPSGTGESVAIRAIHKSSTHIYSLTSLLELKRQGILKLLPLSLI